MGRLIGKIAIVTGSGRGIGRSTALKLAAEGAKVVINDIDPEPVGEVVREIEAAGGEALGFPGSVTHERFAKDIVETTIDTYGDLHIIVNNAGYTWDAVIQNMSEKQFDAMIDVHLKAPWRILQAAAEFLRVTSKTEAVNGKEVIRKVVNISSAAGSRGNAGQTNYASAKAGLIGLTKTLSKEWGRYKVNVNSVAFGFIQTRGTVEADQKIQYEIDGNKIGMGLPSAVVKATTAAIPMGRAGTADEAAGAILLFCLPESDYISGQLIEVTGGL